MSLLDRTDNVIEDKKNKDFLEIALRPNIDHNIVWHCSLRQQEHDFNYDGIPKFTKNNFFDKR